MRDVYAWMRSAFMENKTKIEKKGNNIIKHMWNKFLVHLHKRQGKTSLREKRDRVFNNHIKIGED